MVGLRPFLFSAWREERKWKEVSRIAFCVSVIIMKRHSPADTLMDLMPMHTVRRHKYQMSLDFGELFERVFEMTYNRSTGEEEKCSSRILLAQKSNSIL